MTMITPSYLGETIEYSSLHACRSTLEDPTGHVRAVLVGVVVLVRDRWRLVRRLRERTGLRFERPVRVQRRLVPRRVLQRKHLRALRLAVGLPVRHGRRGLQRVRRRQRLLERRVHVRRRSVRGLLHRYGLL